MDNDTKEAVRYAAARWTMSFDEALCVYEGLREVFLDDEAAIAHFRSMDADEAREHLANNNVGAWDR